MREWGVPRWFTNLFESRSSEAEIDDEVVFHLEMRAERHVLEGMSEEDAVELANKEFGDIETIKRGMRRARTHPFYALGAALAAVGIVVALWLYDSSRSSELPSLPPGMRFVGGPPPAP